jgi:signal transduction histidine kinase
MWNSLVKSTTFRLSLLAVPLHLLAGLALLAFVYVNTLAIMERRVDTGLMAERQRLLEDLKNRDREGLIRAFKSRVQAERGSSRLYLLVEDDGTPISGNYDAEPREIPSLGNFSDAHVRREQGGKDVLARLYAVALPGSLQLVLGRDVAEEEPFRRVVEESLAFAVLLTVLLAVAAGTLASRSVARRLGGFNQAARRILHGDLKERLPVSVNGDEFDHMAENLNEALERIGELMNAARQVANNIAHDLRSPLSRVRNRLELALVSSGAEIEREEAIAASVEDIDQLLDTFEALLSIARMDHGLAPDLHPVALPPLIEDVADYYRPLAEEKDLSLETRIGADLKVMADQHLLFQALSNVVDNAVRYTPEGGTVVISLERAGDQIALCVADNGPGIPPDMHESVLKRFVRLDSSRNQPGNGLGLSVVRAVAQHHKARLVMSDNLPGLRLCLVFPPIPDSQAQRS